MKKHLLITHTDGTAFTRDLPDSLLKQHIGLKANSIEVMMLCQSVAAQGYWNETLNHWVAPGFIKTVKPVFE
jgi:hypothetical protein